MSGTYIDAKYHVTMRTEDERPLITAQRRDGLCRYIHGIVRNHNGQVVQIGGMEDHLHILLGIHPAANVADTFRLIKANSARWLNEHGDGRGWFRWQPGYAAFTVGSLLVPKVQRFLMNQEELHRRMSSDHELKRMIEKHGLALEDSGCGRRRGTHAWLGFHFVFRVKHSMPMITSERKERLYRRLPELVAEQQGRLLEAGGRPDHVHLLAEIPRTLAVADFLEKLKSQSSHALGEFSWQRGYGAFSVSRSQVPVVARYIQRQEEHHQGISFEDEFRKLLAEHGLTPLVRGRETAGVRERHEI